MLGEAAQTRPPLKGWPHFPSASTWSQPRGKVPVRRAWWERGNEAAGMGHGPFHPMAARWQRAGESAVTRACACLGRWGWPLWPANHPDRGNSNQRFLFSWGSLDSPTTPWGLQPPPLGTQFCGVSFLGPKEYSGASRRKWRKTPPLAWYPLGRD